jgi:hypothetical protein
MAGDRYFCSDNCRELLEQKWENAVFGLRKPYFRRSSHARAWPFFADFSPIYAKLAIFPLPMRCRRPLLQLKKIACWMSPGDI